MDMTTVFWAFVVGGTICVVGQLLLDVMKLTPAHAMCVLVVAGAILGGLGIYEPLVEIAGAGASVPISSFGNALLQGAWEEMEAHEFLGVITGIFSMTSAGISSAIIFSFLGALVFKPRN